MKTLAKLTLVLGAIAIGFVPVNVQAHEPPHREIVGDHHHHHRQGLRITSVAYRSPAQRAGLERGDVILELDGRDIHNGEELHRALHGTGYRGVLTVRDLRHGHIHRVQVFPSGGHIGITVERR